MAESEKKLIPPYVSWRTFSSYIQSLQQAIPPRIDKSGMANLSGTNQAWMMSTLKYLKLIREDGTPENELRQLVAAFGPDRRDEYREILQAILRNAYPYLFDGSGSFDLASSTPSHFSEKFKKQGASGDTVRRCESFFITATKEAGITISPHILAARKRGRRTGQASSTTARTKQPKEERSEGNGQGNRQSPSTSQDTQIKLVLLESLAEKFPEFDPNWDANAQLAWFGMYERLLNIVEGRDEGK
jgi:hypothetical protein